MRAGWMAAFDSFENFQKYSDDILKLIEDFSTPTTINSKVMDALEAAESASDGNRLSTSINVSMSDPVSQKPAGDATETSMFLYGCFEASFWKLIKCVCPFSRTW